MKFYNATGRKKKISLSLSLSSKTKKEEKKRRTTKQKTKGKYDFAGPKRFRPVETNERLLNRAREPVRCSKNPKSLFRLFRIFHERERQIEEERKRRKTDLDSDHEGRN